MSRATERLRSFADHWVPSAVSSPSAQWINAGAGLVGAVVVLVTQGAGGLAALAVAVATQGLVALVVWVGCSFSRAGGSTRLMVVLAAGLLRGVALSAALDLMGVTRAGIQQVGAVLASMITTCVWLVAAGLAVHATRDYRALFSSRFQRAVAEGFEAAERHSSSAWSAAASAARVEHLQAWERLSLTAARSDGSVDADVAHDVLEIAQALHAAASDRVRPLSHSLWADAARRPPDLTARAIVVRTFGHWPAPVALTSLTVGAFVLVIVLIGAASTSGPSTAFLAAACCAVAAWACLAPRNLVLARGARGAAGVCAALLAAVAPVAVAVLETAGHALGFPEAIGAAVVAGLAAFGLAFAIVLLAGIRRYRTAVLAEMDRLLATGFWRTEVALGIESRHSADAATYLHHRVQSQLLSVALSLEMAARGADPAALALSVEQARERLSYAPEPAFPSGADALTVASLAAEWEGICEVEVDLPATSALTPAEWYRVDLLAREAVANAVRAGGARAVRLQVRSQDESIEVTVIDDGPRQQLHATGLGSTWLSAIAAGDWELRSHEDGHELRVLLHRQATG